MNKNLTELVLVVDRSGSMSSCQVEAQNGINTLISEQKTKDGECNFTLVQFDDKYEFVHTASPIASVPEFRLIPRGMTALLDAVGQAINKTGERLALLEEVDRPGLVVFVIVTDGGENSSQEFTKTQIKDMIELQRNTYSWQFTFLGANQDAFAEAQGIGIPKMSAANYTGANTQKAFVGASANVGRMRGAAMAGQVVDNSYTEQEVLSFSE